MCSLHCAVYTEVFKAAVIQEQQCIIFSILKISENKNWVIFNLFSTEDKHTSAEAELEQILT